MPQLTSLFWLLGYKAVYLTTHSRTVFLCLFLLPVHMLLLILTLHSSSALLVCVREFQASLPMRLSLSLLVMSLTKLQYVVCLSDGEQTQPGRGYGVPVCALHFVFWRSFLTTHLQNMPAKICLQNVPAKSAVRWLTITCKSTHSMILLAMLQPWFKHSCMADVTMVCGCSMACSTCSFSTVLLPALTTDSSLIAD